MSTLSNPARVISSKLEWETFRNTWTQVHRKVEEALAAHHDLPIVVEIYGTTPRDVLEKIAEDYRSAAWDVTIHEPASNPDRHPGLTWMGRNWILELK